MTIQKEKEKHVLIFQLDNNYSILLFLYGPESMEHSIPIDNPPKFWFYHTQKWWKTGSTKFRGTFSH